MSRPDEGLIHAWLDGELDAAETARVEALVRTDAEWAAAAAEARGLIAASSRILGALDDVPAHVVPGAGRQLGIPPEAQGRASRRGAPWWTLRVAALLVIVAGSAVVMSRSGVERETVLDAAVQPASAPKSDAPPSLAPAPLSPPGSATRKDAAPSAPADARDAKQAPGRAEAVTRPTAEREMKAAAPVAGAEQQARNEQSANRARVTDSLMRKLTNSPLALNQVVTTGVAEPTSRRALGMTVGSTFAGGDAAKSTLGKTVSAAEECYREPRPVAGTTPAVVRVSRLSDSTATMLLADEARRKAEQNFARVAPSVFRVRGDTLFVGTVDGVPRVAIRVSCPAP